jgi:hypothetical protein
MGRSVSVLLFSAAAGCHGIWRVPHVVGALRAGRPQQPQRADQVPADQRKPVPGAYGAEMLTKRAFSASP